MKATLGPILMINNNIVPESWILLFTVNRLKLVILKQLRNLFYEKNKYGICVVCFGGFSILVNMKHDTCHEKTDLKVFVVVILKEGLAVSHMAPTMKYYSASFIDYIL